MVPPIISVGWSNKQYFTALQAETAVFCPLQRVLLTSLERPLYQSAIGFCNIKVSHCQSTSFKTPNRRKIRLKKWASLFLCFFFIIWGLQMTFCQLTIQGDEFCGRCEDYLNGWKDLVALRECYVLIITWIYFLFSNSEDKLFQNNFLLKFRIEYLPSNNLRRAEVRNYWRPASFPVSRLELLILPCQCLSLTNNCIQ